jgi:hypothetical protein
LPVISYFLRRSLPPGPSRRPPHRLAWPLPPPPPVVAVPITPKAEIRDQIWRILLFLQAVGDGVGRAPGGAAVEASRWRGAGSVAPAGAFMTDGGAPCLDWLRRGADLGPLGRGCLLTFSWDVALVAPSAPV